LSAAFLCAGLGITPETREDYVATWLEVFKNHKRVISTAAAHVQRMADLLYGRQTMPLADR
jgi:antirestriction protein ArdC